MFGKAPAGHALSLCQCQSRTRASHHGVIAVNHGLSRESGSGVERHGELGRCRRWNGWMGKEESKLCPYSVLVGAEPGRVAILPTHLGNLEAE